MTSQTEPLLSDLETGEDPASPLPAFVFDTTARMLVAANAAGWRAWGLAGGDAFGGDGGPVALDQAMPALARLPHVAGSPDGETLTFWTMRGLLQLRCRVRAIASGRFLVRAVAGQRVVLPRPTGGRGAGPALAAPPRQDVHHHIRHDVPSPAQVRDMARLAHEVRTPLSAAIAYAELLKEEHFGPLGSARYREYARNAYDSARLALSVVDGMLVRESWEPGGPGEPAGAGAPELAFRDLDPAGVIDNCLAVARPLAERAGLDLTASCAPGTPRVIADEVSLKQMLLNLITNAIKFARPGDRVTLAAAYGDDGCLRIEVADTGPGMAPMPPMPGGMAAPPLPPSAAADDAAGSAPGHGIGLPLTRALAEANGAALIVDSAPGRGTRVTIAFDKDRVVPV
jgi:signal transduction histidine kinase